jgi:adenylate kinase
LAILGLPGAGKGTQASMIAKRLGYATIAIGELIRRRIDAGGPAGAELARHVGSGALVPNELTLALVKSSLDTSHRDRVLFDGIPRTAEQAVELDQLRRVDLAIHLEVPVELVSERLARRRVCRANGHIFAVVTGDVGQWSICPSDGSALEIRGDDAPEVIERRIEIQSRNLCEVVTHYRGSNRLVPIAGDQQPAEVTDQIIGAIARRRSRSRLGWIHPGHGWIAGVALETDDAAES